MGIERIASQWRQAAWHDDPPPRIGYHATALGAAKSIERGGFHENPYGVYFASSPEDALRFVALRIATGQFPGGMVGVVSFDTSGLDILAGGDHSPAFFGQDTTSWVTHDPVGPERVYGVEVYEFGAEASRTASMKAAMQTGPSGDDSRVYYGLVHDYIPKGAGQQAIIAYVKPKADNDNMFPLGVVLFDDQHLVSIHVSEHARGHGIAKNLLKYMDQHVGRQLPDDGYRTKAGAGLLNHLGRPKGKFVKWVSEGDVIRPISNLHGFAVLWQPEEDFVTKVFNP